MERCVTKATVEKYLGTGKMARDPVLVLTMTDRSVMEGHWKDGALLYGEYKNASGAVTRGKWDEGVVEEGKVHYPGGDQFWGKFKADGTYDFGTLTLPGGVVYFGEFQRVISRHWGFGR